MIGTTQLSTALLAILPALLLGTSTNLVSAAGPAPFVYKPSDWPPINGDVKTGLGAPPPAANPAFSKDVGYTAAPGTPPVRLKTDNPQTGGVCPKTGNFGSNGTCWWTCGFDSDGFPCTTNDDVKQCQPGKWALSYDDGPTNNTDPLLSQLKANNLKATFCLVGSQVVRFPEQAKRIADAGHDLCVHTWSHSALTTQTDDEIIAEFKWTEKAIEAATGIRPKYARAPFGDMDNRVRAILKKMGYTVLYWLYDTSDFKTFPGTTTPNVTAQSIMDDMNVQLTKISSFPQGIVTLGHPEKADVGVTLATNFMKVAAGKVSLVRVSDCLNDKTPFLANANTPLQQKTATSSAARLASPVSIATTSGVIGAALLALFMKTSVAV